MPRKRQPSHTPPRPHIKIPRKAPPQPFGKGQGRLPRRRRRVLVRGCR
jgi:hypothetical protein